MSKTYGKRRVLTGVSLEVNQGELVALLGPNGAGKTTLMEMATGLRKPDGGQVLTFGLNPRKASKQVRQGLGVILQSSSLEPELSTQELIDHVRALYPCPAQDDRLLGLLGLRDLADVRIRHLSGGQKRRVELACALVGQPDLLVLDEPTTGIDPESRRVIWHMIDQERHRGTAILLSTHMVNEAARLCDRVAILLRGRLVTCASPAELTAQEGATVRFACNPEQSELPGHVIDCASLTTRLPDGLWQLRSAHPQELLRALLDWAEVTGLRLHPLWVEPPDFESRYLELLNANDTAWPSAATGTPLPGRLTFGWLR